jgi:hypothetical protein
VEKYQIHRFQELEGTKQAKILELLRCAALAPEHHQVRAQRSGVSARPYGFRVELPQRNPSCTQITDNSDLGSWLIENGFVEHGDMPWKTFRFYPHVIAWYRNSHPLTEAEERERIGRYYFELGVSDDDLEPFNAENVAEKVGLPADRVQMWVRALTGAGVLFDDGPKDSGTPPYYKLTKPKGFDWAIGGFRADVGATAQVDLSVTVNVDMDRVIQAINRLEIPSDQKRFYELSVVKLERELKQGRLNWDTVKDALSTAANVKEVAVPIITLVSSNMDQIADAVSQLPTP